MEGRKEERKKKEEYACAEGGAHLPIAHAIRVRRVKRKSKWKIRKKKKKEKKNNAKFGGNYVRPRTHNVSAHILCSHQLLFIILTGHKFLI